MEMTPSPYLSVFTMAPIRLLPPELYFYSCLFLTPDFTRLAINTNFNLHIFESSF